jgi:RNA polymerase sigma-70 factor (ECF subfamily)
VALLKEDATYTMPPWLQWYAGRDAMRSFFAMAWKSVNDILLIPTTANRQPAFAMYIRTGADAPWTAHAIHVLTLEHDLISRLTLFVDPAGPRLFPAFGLPLVLPDAAKVSAGRAL